MLTKSLSWVAIVFVVAGCGSQRASELRASELGADASKSATVAGQVPTMNCPHRIGLTESYDGTMPGAESALAAAERYAKPGESLDLARGTAARAEVRVISRSGREVVAMVTVENFGSNGWIVGAVEWCENAGGS